MKAVSKIFWREWKRLFQLPAFYVVFLVIPPILYFFYGFIYQKQFARDLPVALWDEDRSEISRKLVDMMATTPSVHFAETVHSEEELKKAMFAGKISAAIHFPKDFEAKIKKGEKVEVTLYNNAAALVGAKIIYKDVAGVVIKGGLGVVLQKQTRQGMSPAKAQALVQPIKLNTYTLYNPSYNYKDFLTPGLITVAVQMALLLLAVLLLNYEKKTDTEQELIRLAQGSASAIIVGKTLAFLTLSWYLFVLIFFVVFPFFDLNLPSSILNVFVLYNFLVLACIGVGMMVSAIVDDVMVATDVALFFTSPAFVFSGFTFPRWAMPWYDQFYADIMPYTYFMDGFVKAYFMGLPPKYFQSELLSLSLIMVTGFGTALIFYQFKINKIKNHVS